MKGSDQVRLVGTEFSADKIITALFIFLLPRTTQEKERKRKKERKERKERDLAGIKEEQEEC